MNLIPIDCSLEAEPVDPDPYALANAIVGSRGVTATVTALTDTGQVLTYTVKGAMATLDQRPATRVDLRHARQVRDDLTAFLPDED